MNLWYDILQTTNDIQFIDEEDATIWQFKSCQKYPVQSLYAVINDMGIKQVYTPVMWIIPIPLDFIFFVVFCQQQNND
jgi:hypothetical protein